MNPIPCTERLPEDGETVIFWLEEDQGNYSHGCVMIGNFNGVKRFPPDYQRSEVYIFSTPGHGWYGTHWCEIPEHLKDFKPQ